MTFEVAFYDNAGGFVAAFEQMVDLRYSFFMKEPGSIWGEFAMSDTEMGTDTFRPKINDFELTIDGAFVMSGIVDSVNFKSEVGTVEFTGRDYLYWLDQPWPFEAYTTYTNLSALLASTTPEDFTKQWASADGATVGDVVDDLLDPLLVGTYSPNVPGLTPAYSGGSFAESLDWSVYFGDSTSVLDHLRAISDAYDPMGFDFWVDGGTLNLVGPRLTNPSAVSPTYSFTSAANIVEIDWTNNGPMTTDIFGMGSGSGNVRGFYRKTNTGSVDQFRRWRSIVNFQSPAADLTSDNILQNLVESGEFLEPQKELRLTVKPDFIDGGSGESIDGFLNHIGQAVDVDYTMPDYHRIDAYFYVVGQTYYTPDGSNFLLDYTLAQVY